MIIFGWGFTTNKKIFPISSKDRICCDNFLILYRRLTWFTLFFIPVIPYSTKYFAVCPYCGSVRDVPTEYAEKWIKQTEE